MNTRPSRFLGSVFRTATARLDRGIVLGGSGQGEQLAANKVVGARAALCNDLYTARLSRAHNDANILSIGARIVAPALAEEIVRLWLTTPFDSGRHAARVAQLHAIEQRQPRGATPRVHTTVSDATDPEETDDDH